MRFRFVARLGSRGTQLRPFVVGSFLVHAGAVVFCTLLGFREAPARNMEFFTIDLVGALPSSQVSAPPAAQATPRPAPPEPEPEPEAEVEPEGPRVEERQVVQTQKPPKEPEPKPDPPPRQRPTSTPDSGRPATGAGGDPDGLVLEEGGAGIGGGLEGGGSELSWYNTAVASALYNNWRQPGVTAAEPLQVAVRFEILRDGTVRGLEIAESSGVGVLDRSVLRAVTNASPLPPIPRDWSGSTISARYLFELNPEE